MILQSPVAACPPSRIYRFRKAVIRNRLAFAAAAAIAGILLGATGSVYEVAFTRSGRAFGAVISDSQARLWDSTTAAPPTERFADISRGVNLALLSADDHRLTTHRFDSQAVTVPLQLPDKPAPTWLADLAEAVAGERVRTNGAVELVPPGAFIALRHRLEHLPGQNRRNAKRLLAFPQNSFGGGIGNFSIKT